MRSITLLSPAKINLFFEITARRNDNYHEIRTLMQPVDVFDQVAISVGPGKGIEVEMKELELSDPGENLALRAAELFIEKTKLTKSISITIQKQIPAGAGLGGGSGNAAAVLVGLNRLTEALNHTDLFSISPALGADVPFFISCTTSCAEGIGEIITPAHNFPLLNYVILYPGFSVSTKEIYDEWDLLHNNKQKTELHYEGKSELISSFLNKKNNFPLFNDLEAPAFKLYPEIKYYRDMLSSLGADSVLMSGSGSAVYAVFGEEERADEIYNYLKTSDKFRIFKAKGITGWHRLVS